MGNKLKKNTQPQLFNDSMEDRSSVNLDDAIAKAKARRKKRERGEKYPVDPHVDVTARKHKGNPESRKANLVAAPHKDNKRESIYRWFQRNGPAITEDFILANPEWHYPTITARISELKRDGFLEKVGERPTKYSQSPAAILQATEKLYPIEGEKKNGV